ncbi:MAG: hypothetical protein AAF968_16860 [Pseudomonadota bacterium]
MLGAGLAPRPTGGQRFVTVIAKNEAAKREVGIDVLPRRGLGTALEAFPDALEGLETDQPFMMPFTQGDIPARHLDISGIEDPGQQLSDPLIADLSVRQILWIGGLALQKALHLDLRFKSTGGIALKGLLQDRSNRLIPYQQLAVCAGPLEAIADRCTKDVIAIHCPRPHPVDGLLRVLLALMLGDARQQVLDQDRVRVFAKLDRGALKCPPCDVDCGAQLIVRLDPTGEPGDVIDDDDRLILLVLTQEGKHRLHPGPGGQTAREIIAEDPGDLIALEARIFFTARLLRGEAVTARRLLHARDPAVNHGRSEIRLDLTFGGHDSYSLAAAGSEPPATSSN